MYTYLSIQINICVCVCVFVVMIKIDRKKCRPREYFLLPCSVGLLEPTVVRRRWQQVLIKHSWPRISPSLPTTICFIPTHFIATEQPLAKLTHTLSFFLTLSISTQLLSFVFCTATTKQRPTLTWYLPTLKLSTYIHATLLILFSLPLAISPTTIKFSSSQALRTLTHLAKFPSLRRCFAHATTAQSEVRGGTIIGSFNLYGRRVEYACIKVWKIFGEYFYFIFLYYFLNVRWKKFFFFYSFFFHVDIGEGGAKWTMGINH